MIPSLVRATYRLQFNAGFTFNDARRQVPYLQKLGISHCYGSPVLKARSGSGHGYDIVDHNRLNPELGTREDFELFVKTLHEHDMGLILDIVPNHMGIGGSDNDWWLDVLENGQASGYADYFDIDWQPSTGLYAGKVLFPILGDYYGNVLDRGEIKLSFVADQGRFTASYFEHLLPIDPKTYPLILMPVLSLLSETYNGSPTLLARLQGLITGFHRLPARHVMSKARRAQRQQLGNSLKLELSEIHLQESAVRQAVNHGLELFNGREAAGSNFNLLHKLLEKQVYRLAYWKTAADEINYRRFFNLNSLAALCQEKPEVFTATHRLILNFIEQGLIQGLRIDHPDGLHDPRAYYLRLNAEIGKRLGQKQGVDSETPQLYVVSEKILAGYEKLPLDWRVHGTTGYDFGALVNGLFIPREGEKALTRIYRMCTGSGVDSGEHLYKVKKLIIKTQLAGELTVLANLLKRIAELDRHTRDFTLTGLRDALVEVVARFPVYRTYITGQEVGSEDKRYVNWAVDEARKRNGLIDRELYDFIKDTLLLERKLCKRPGVLRVFADFTMKFQQYTAPVMAKAKEDTFFYRDYRLISLNEVGGGPEQFSVSRAMFHRANSLRLEHWPHAMLATSTHDSKRGEDVRARINVLGEIPELWKQRVKKWQKYNHRHRTRVKKRLAPDRNDEYLLYQTLIGTWPVFPADGKEMGEYGERIKAYMRKAIREAKLHSSWRDPDPEYEDGVLRFVTKLLRPDSENRFYEDLTSFVKTISRFGLLNSLSQLLLKLTCPGVPDIYQGNEVWNFSLVDPDNRRAVDYNSIAKLLNELDGMGGEEPEALLAIESLLENLEDGRAKLFVTAATLRLRKQCPELFSEGSYEPLTIQGPAEQHLCVISRALGRVRIIVVAPRFYGTRANGNFSSPSEIVPNDWEDTSIGMPETELKPVYRNIFTGRTHQAQQLDKPPVLEVASLLHDFPVALLYSAGE